MESQNQKLNTVLRIPNTEIYVVENEKIYSLVTGTMTLIELPGSNTYIISVEDFGYPRSKDVPVMAKKLASGESIYILPNAQGYFGLKLSANTNAQLVSVFESILQNSGEFIVEVDKPLLQENAKEIGAETINTADSSEAQEVVIEDAQDTDYVVKSGEVIREGLIKAATFAAGGISKAGSFLVNKLVSKTDEVQVTESTKKKIRFAKTATTKVAGAAGFGFKVVVSAAGFVVRTVGKKIDNCGQSSEKPGVHTALKLGKSAIQAAATVYDGMHEAADVITKEVAKTTADAMTHRYGPQMGEATHEVFEIVENVGNVYGGMTKRVVRALASEQRKAVTVVAVN